MPIPDFVPDPMSPGAKHPLRPHWRKMTWAIVTFNLLMLVLATMGGSALLPLWVFGEFVLGVLWLATRGRSCPVCGRGVQRGLVTCKSCGFDFRSRVVR